MGNGGLFMSAENSAQLDITTNKPKFTDWREPRKTLGTPLRHRKPDCLTHV